MLPTKEEILQKRKEKINGQLWEMGDCQMPTKLPKRLNPKPSFGIGRMYTQMFLLSLFLIFKRLFLYFMRFLHPAVLPPSKSLPMCTKKRQKGVATQNPKNKKEAPLEELEA
jgi:hypothetical protein